MIIKKSAILFILLFVMSLPVWANETTGNINLIAGEKTWSDDWESISKQDEFGASFDIKDKSWPVSIAIEAYFASEEKTDILPQYFGEESDLFRSIEDRTREFCLGVKKIIDIQGVPLKPFLGAGLAYVFNEVNGKFFYIYDQSISSFSDDDSVLGFWVSGGIYITLFDRINAGVIARMSWAEVNQFNHKIEVGGEHYGIFIGYHW